ncbi:helix-turn-helix domain-containing protein [Streptomyces sp. NPDC058254]|uniref:helix-turn-helix domain-containing protein n=1 Tax=Streptomyces sp. NPDC058254 TaxID=3346406 RepID=UPI0036E9568A
MEHPGRGQSHTVRSLAKATGISRTQIGRLVSGQQAGVGVNEAHHIAESLGVAVLVLFVPPPSPNGDAATPEPHPHRKE